MLTPHLALYRIIGLYYLRSLLQNSDIILKLTINISNMHSLQMLIFVYENILSIFANVKTKSILIMNV